MSFSIFLSFSPSSIAWQRIPIINEIDFEASSFAGIGNSISEGSELVSTIAKTGIPNLLASLTAICSFETSTIKSADGSLVRSIMLPSVFSSFALWRVTCNLSRFERFKKVPSVAILSIDDIFLTALRIVGKLVSIPPGQRSVT